MRQEVQVAHVATTAAAQAVQGAQLLGLAGAMPNGQAHMLQGRVAAVESSLLELGRPLTAEEVRLRDKLRREVARAGRGRDRAVAQQTARKSAHHTCQLLEFEVCLQRGEVCLRRYYTNVSPLPTGTCEYRVSLAQEF